MSPIEQARNQLERLHLMATEKGDELMIIRFAAQLAALDALIAERDAANARAEKADAELEQANAVLRYATKTKDQYHSENYALRKALEDAGGVLERIARYEERNDGTDSLAEVKAMAEAAHAALHGTAKQERAIDSFASKFPPGTTFIRIQTEPAADAAPSPKPLVCGDCADRMTCAKYGHRYPGDFACNDFQPKPRTCGECAHIGKGTCVCIEPSDYACNYFQPRADAQKGANA